MEALSTYNTIQDIANKAAQNYRLDLGDAEQYAKKIVSFYRSEDSSNPIKDNVYYRYLLEEYTGTVRNEIVRMIKQHSLDGCNDE